MSEPSRDVSAALLVIGDEILSGRTKDRNIGAVAEHLTGIGIQLREVRIVPDIEAEIVSAISALRSRFDYVFTTGGIGPTHDDITADSVALALNRNIDFDPRADAILKDYYGARGSTVSPARRRMARIPEGARLIENPVSGAPGFMVDDVIVLAGVPDIMRAMLERVTPELRTGRKIHTITIEIDVAESEIAERFAAHQRAHPDVVMGSYPRMRNGHPASDLVLRSADADHLRDVADRLRQALAIVT